MTRRLSFRDLHDMARGRKCMWCRKPMESVHIHHINHDHTDNRVGNIALICQECHRIYHSDNGCRMTGKYADTPECNSIVVTSLGAWMTKTNTTQVALSKATGIKQGHISGYLSGKKKLSPESAQKMIAVTNGVVTLEELLFPEKGAE